MNAPIEIKINSDVLEELLLTSIKNSIPDVKENSLKMLSQKEVAEILNVSKDQVAMLREYKIIKSIKTGKNYMFSQESIKQFQKEYAGYDVSNKMKALKAFEEVQKKKAVAGTTTKD